jgi:hypothetical protein
MSSKSALQVILAIGLLGLSFSGYLSYRELSAATSEQVCTPVGQPGTILGYPPCVYGLGMYLIIVVVAALGLHGRFTLPQQDMRRAQS